MPQFLLKWRRDRAAERIVRNGKQLDRLRVRRADVNGSYEHTAADADYLDTQVRRLETCIQRDIDFIRKTAKEVS